MKAKILRLVPLNSTELCCTFREPWMGPHPLCEIETERMHRLFLVSVEQGGYNAQGYTPSEWKARTRKEEV